MLGADVEDALHFRRVVVADAEAGEFPLEVQLVDCAEGFSQGG